MTLHIIYVTSLKGVHGRVDAPTSPKGHESGVQRSAAADFHSALPSYCYEGKRGLARVASLLLILSDRSSGNGRRKSRTDRTVLC